MWPYDEERGCPARNGTIRRALKPVGPCAGRDVGSVRPRWPTDRRGGRAASQGFTKALIERALGAELSHHLGYPAGAPKPEATSNHGMAPARSGCSPTTGRCRSPSPGSARHVRAAADWKHERRFTGVADKIIKTLATCRPAKPRPSCCGWRCAISPPVGPVSSFTGARPWCDLPYSTATDSRRPFRDKPHYTQNS